MQAVLPAAPSFTATAVSATQINLAWTRVARATGYLVDVWINGVWKQIGSLGSGSTGCAVTGLSPKTTYYFDVAAYNAAGRTWANYQMQPHSPIHAHGLSTILLQSTRMASTTTTKSSMARCLVPTGRCTPMSTRPESATAG